MTVSGSEWLPSMPERWRVVPAKALFALRSEPNRSDDQHLTPSQKYGVVSQAHYMAMTGSRVVLALTGADSMQHVEPGDFVIHLRSFQGGIEYSQYRGKVSPAYTVLRPRAHVHAAFYRHMLKAERYIQALRVTVNQLRDGQSIRYQDFGKAALPLPPIGRQVAIADFLDRETAKIDALIDKQNTFIARIAERRAGLATSVLTEDPAWPTLPLRRLATHIVDCPHWTPETVDESPYEAVRSSCVRDGRYRPELALLVSQETFDARSRGLQVEPNDVLLAREAPAGEACLAPRGRKLCLGQRTVLVRLDSTQIDPVLALANIYSQRTRDYFATESNGTTVSNLRLPVIRRLNMVVPPRHLQDELVDRYQVMLAAADDATDRAERLIALAQERRAALITAAVTGQLDIGGAA